MPVLSMFFGIIIKMYWIDHNPPHIHVIYNEHEAIFDFDGNLIEGELPNKQQKLIIAWIALHEDELKANWKLAENKEPLFKIDPLK